MMHTCIKDNQSEDNKLNHENMQNENKQCKSVAITQINVLRL